MKLIVLAALFAITHAQNEVPKSAKTDLAKDAQAKAAEEVGKFNTMMDTEAKTKAGYDKLDAAGKKKYDDAAKLKADARKKRDDDEKTAAGYATMTAE